MAQSCRALVGRQSSPSTYRFLISYDRLRTLGVTEPVTSPTFVLAKAYDLSGKEFSKLVHIDAYRLTEGKDLRALDLARTLEDSRTLVILEWPEMVEDGLPHADVAITLTVRSDTERDIAYA